MQNEWQKHMLPAGTAKYRGLLNVIRQARDGGRIFNGDQLPPVREMAYQMGITPGTVARAYQLGIEEGMLEARVGRGTFLRRPNASRPKAIMFGETHVESGIVDLRNAAVPDFGQDAVLNSLMQQVFVGGSHSMVRYAGHNELVTREAILAWAGLQDSRAKPEDLVLTYGSQNATLAAFLCNLKGPQPIIATDMLVLPGTRRAAELARAKLVGLHVDNDGMIPKELD